MKDRIENAHGSFLYLTEDDAKWVIKNIRCCFVWSGYQLYLLSKDTFEWHLTGEAMEVLNDEKLIDRFVKCGYQLDTRKIQYNK